MLLGQFLVELIATGITATRFLKSMPRYFFDLCNAHGWLADPEGVELADDEVAQVEALTFVRGLIAEEVREGTPINLGHFLTVRTEAGREIFRLHYRDTVQFHDTSPES